MLTRHVELFDQGVRAGDFEPMLEGFADNAELAIEGVPVGPFAGEPAIVAAYRAQPPDDEVEILDAVETAGGTIVAGYAWRRTAPARAGELRIDSSHGKIARLVVTFQGQRRPHW